MKKAKKINKTTKKDNAIFSQNNEMAKLIILVAMVAVAFAIFYIITLFVVKKDSDTNDDTSTPTEVTIQYEKILVSNILSQNSSEYYVLAYTNNDPFLDAYENYLIYYETAKENTVPYYYVELNNTFNKNFLSDKSKLNVENSQDFKFSQTTLLRIKDGKVISTYEGNESITGKLSRMTK